MIKLSIRGKIISLTGFLLACLIVVGACTAWYLNLIEDNQREITDQLAPEVQLASLLYENINQKALLVENYLRTGDVKYVNQMRELENSLQESLESAHPEHLQNSLHLDDFMQHNRQYATTFLNNVVVKHEEMEKNADKITSLVIPEIHKLLNNIALTAEREGATELYRSSSAVLQAFQQTNIAILQFINHPSSRHKGRMELELMSVEHYLFFLTQDVTYQDEGINYERRVRWLGQVNRQFKEFKQDFDTLVASIEHRNQLVEQELIPLQQKIQQEVWTMRDIAWNKSKEKMSQVGEAVINANTIIATTTVAALVVGLILSLVLSMRIAAPVRKVVELVKDIAQGEGDLTKRLHIRSNDEMGDLAHWFNRFVDNMEQLVLKIRQSTVQVSQAAEDLVSSATQMSDSSAKMRAQTDTLAEGSESMTQNVNAVAASTEQASVNMNGINQNVDTISKELGQAAKAVESMSDSLTEVSKSTQQAMRISNEADQSAQATLQTMHDLGSASSKIGDVIQLINDIARQTRMLALNATIEAASAGEAGKGFTVVAAEVKNLAVETSNASDEISGEINRIQDSIDESLENTKSVSTVISSVNEINRGIAKTMTQQSSAAEHLNHTLDSVSDSSRNAVRNVREAAAGIKEIAQSSSGAYDFIKEVNANVQSILGATNDLSQGINGVKSHADSLAGTAKLLKNLVGTFRITEVEETQSVVLQAKVQPKSLSAPLQ